MQCFRFVLSGLLLPLLVCATPALAELRFCNRADVVVSVAIGYKGDSDWTSEGWWTMAPGNCATVIAGDLPGRFYYWRATFEGGDFVTEDYHFCTSPKEFTIVGDQNCDARGFDSLPFNQVDIGDAIAHEVVLSALDRPQGDQSDHEAVLSDLQGNWLDATDDAIGMRIEGNRLLDIFAGIVGGAATITIEDTCDGADGTGPVMRVVYDDFPQDPLCWVLLSLDTGAFRFRAVGGTADVTMLRQ